MSDFRLDYAVQEVECPHCQGHTRHSSPAATILFARSKCEHCGVEFLIVQNEPWPGDNGLNRQRS